MEDPGSSSLVFPPPSAAATSVSFVSHPNHEEYDMEPGIVKRVRQEVVDLAMLADLRFLAPQHQQQFDADPRDYPAVDALVIERSMRGTSDLLVHSYALTPQVLEYLEKSPIELLQEDAAFLQFAMALSSQQTASGRGAATAQRPSIHRVVSAVQRENAQLRSRIRQLEVKLLAASSSLPRRGGAGGGSPPTSATSEGMRKASPTTSGAAPSASSHQQHDATAALDAEDGRRPQSQHHGGNDPSALPLHSPLSWDMETDAMINARTAYDPYRTRTKGGVDMRLDQVTQSQMVARLHDRSVDQRERRRRENELLVLRELGLQERRVLTLSDQQDMAVRLHDTSISRARDKMKKLQKQYVPAGEHRSLSPTQQKESARRMHDEAMAHARQTHEKLVQKHVIEHDPPTVKLSVDQQKAMADRLSKFNRTAS